MRQEQYGEPPAGKVYRGASEEEHSAGDRKAIWVEQPNGERYPYQLQETTSPRTAPGAMGVQDHAIWLRTSWRTTWATRHHGQWPSITAALDQLVGRRASPGKPPLRSWTGSYLTLRSKSSWNNG